MVFVFGEFWHGDGAGIQPFGTDLTAYVVVDRTDNNIPVTYIDHGLKCMFRAIFLISAFSRSLCGPQRDEKQRACNLQRPLCGVLHIP